MVGGTWSAVAASTEEYDLLWHQLRGMALDSLIYLWGSFFGPLIFLKASPALIDGASDVLNVAFSERGERNTTEKLGTISSLVGVSCIIGPLISDRYTSMERLRSLQEATTFSMFVASIKHRQSGLVVAFYFKGLQGPNNFGIIIGVDRCACIRCIHGQLSLRCPGSKPDNDIGRRQGFHSLDSLSPTRWWCGECKS
jgi:hypothetical protein